jgi:HEXXH motif-containing protein
VAAVRDTVVALCRRRLEVQDPTRPADYAVLNHVMLQLRLAARDRDAAAVRSALETWDNSAAWRMREVAVVAADSCDTRTVDGLDGSVYWLRPDTWPTAATTRELDETLEAVRRAGFAALVASATGVVVRLDPPAPGSSPVSFTLSFLPGTAHLAWSALPADRGEALVHEAAHSWLNESRGPLGATFPSTPWFDSPWRGVPRPPLGLLHAAFAFSTVACYLDAYPWPADLAAERRERVAAERTLLRRHAGTITQVISMVPDPAVAQMVRRQVDLAVENTAR